MRSFIGFYCGLDQNTVSVKRCSEKGNDSLHLYLYSFNTEVLNDDDDDVYIF